MATATTVCTPIAVHPLRAVWLRHAADRRLRPADLRCYQFALKAESGRWRWYAVKGDHARALDAFRHWGLITQHGRITPAGLLVLATWEMK